MRPNEDRDPLSRRLFLAKMDLDTPLAAAELALHEEKDRLEAALRERLAPLAAAAKALRDEKYALKARYDEVEDGLPITWQQVRAPLVKAGLRAASEATQPGWDSGRKAEANGVFRATTRPYDCRVIWVEVYGDAAGRLATAATVRVTLEALGYTLRVQENDQGVPQRVDVRKYGAPLTEAEVAAAEALAATPAVDEK